MNLEDTSAGVTWLCTACGCKWDLRAIHCTATPECPGAPIGYGRAVTGPSAPVATPEPEDGLTVGTKVYWPERRGTHIAGHVTKLRWDEEIARTAVHVLWEDGVRGIFTDEYLGNLQRADGRPVRLTAASSGPGATPEYFHCVHPDSVFSRTVCPEPCGMMHTYCATCGDCLDDCPHGSTSTGPVTAVEPEDGKSRAEGEGNCTARLSEAAEDEWNLVGRVCDKLDEVAAEIPIEVSQRLAMEIIALVRSYSRDAARAELSAVRARLDRHRAALADALEGMEEVIPYVPEYFREKYGCDDYIARARAMLAEEEQETP